VSTDVSVLDTHSRVFSRLGMMSLYQGKRQLALDYFQRGLDVDRRIVVLRPDDEKQLYALALSYSQLGSVQQEVGAFADAQASYLQMLQVSQRLYERNPEHADAALAYANALYFLGTLDLIAGRDADALPRLVRARDLVLEVRAHDGEAVEPIQLLSAVEISLGNFDKGWQLNELLRKKGLGGDYTRDFLASSFLAGKWSETIALAAGASGNAELTGEIFGALAAALLGDRTAAIARAEHAASLAEQGNFQWFFHHVGNVAGRTGAAEGPLCRQLASEIEAALRKGDQGATAAALKNFAEGLKALPPG
jgi:tetratricopeptide (TPR) repeat protein